MEPFIRISGLRKTYIMGRVQVHALDGVDMEIPPNSFMVVMGPSGSGKSTLLHLLGGLDRPSAGHIEVGGQSLETLDENALAVFRRRAVGFIFQSFNLIPSMTAQENVAFPMQFSRVPRRQRRQRAMELLKDVALDDRASHRPTELSGGQQQRVAIARALVHDPLLVLADEPTGNLDEDTGSQIMDLLVRLTREAGKNLIMATHNLDNVRRADHVFHLHEGKLVEEADERG
jgi:putative ABC transport system ATP-binding protein